MKARACLEAALVALTIGLPLAGCAGTGNSTPAPSPSAAAPSGGVVQASAAARAPGPVLVNPVERPMPDPAGFPAFLEGFRAEALKAGISRATLDRTLTGIRFDEAIIQRDRTQPESVRAFVDYLASAVNDARVRKGQEMMAQHKALLDRLEATYGIPRQALVAFWGLETNFGSILGKNNLFQALATLVYEGRRADFFRGELVSALKLVDMGWVDPTHLQGSWAGAFGHTQFMPSVALKYAVDGDGDGRRDLRDSVPDALTSAANYLRALGWDKSVPWGMQVTLPRGFDYTQLELANAKPVRDWRAAGVTGLGRPLAGDAQPAAILLPQGHTGPAYLVYAANYKAITGWNASISYAIAVGHLSDRLMGGPAFGGPIPAEKPLQRERVARLQQLLTEKGYAQLVTDGRVGRGTREAVRQAQAKLGLIPDGYATEALITALER